MGQPLISVVIPVYNRASMLPVALRSVLAQTFGDFEIIVVDDGSTDDVAAALGGFDAPCIKLLGHRRNRGAAAARNTGARAARGRFIAFLDSDDEWLPEKLARQLTIMESADGATKACCVSYVVTSGEGMPEVLVELAARRDWYRQMLLGCHVGPGTTLLVERACLEAVGGFDEDMRRLEDWDWMLRYTARYKLATTDEVLARVYRGKAPSGDSVRRALEILRDKHLDAASARGRGARRRFLSALLLEEAAIWYRERRLLLATTRLMRSYFNYPFRRLSFYVNIVRKLGELIRTRPERSASGELGVGGARE